MGLFSTLIADITCPKCGEMVSRRVQFKLGDETGLPHYRIGDSLDEDSLEWDGRLLGRVWFSGYGEGSCPACGDEGSTYTDFAIVIDHGRIVDLHQAPVGFRFWDSVDAVPLQAGEQPVPYRFLLELRRWRAAWDSRALLERALAISEALWGPDGPITALSLDDLAKVVHAQGDLEGARTLLERSLAIREARLGADHPGTAWTLDNHARALLERGGPQMVEVSRDGRRVYLTNSIYATWDDIFYPDGVGAWAAKLDADPVRGGLAADQRFFPHGDAFRGLRVHQTRLQGGDASSDSYCHTR